MKIKNWKNIVLLIAMAVLFSMPLISNGSNLSGILFGENNMIFTLTDPKGDDSSKVTDEYAIANEIQQGELDLVSLSAKSHVGETIFEATFAESIKAPDSRVISQAGTTLESYAPNGFYTFNLDTYIDTDGIPGSGKTSRLPGRDAQIDPEFTWEKVVCLNPRPHYGRVALEDEMIRSALNKVLAQKGSLSSEDVKEIEKSVKSDIQQNVYFPSLIWVHGRTVQFSVPDSFFHGKAQREWGYAAGVTISAVVDYIHHAAARSMTRPTAVLSDVVQLPSLVVEQNLPIQRQESAYVDLLMPLKKR
jgi:hypothetical protein